MSRYPTSRNLGELPTAHFLTFPLSKCYPGSIERFSEDIDLTFYKAEGLSNKQIEPGLISGDHFALGDIEYNRVWYIDDPEIMRLIENLIVYSLLRDEYRRTVKDNKK